MVDRMFVSHEEGQGFNPGTADLSHMSEKFLSGVLKQNTCIFTGKHSARGVGSLEMTI